MGDPTTPDTTVRNTALQAVRRVGRNGVRVFLALSALSLLVVGLGPLTGAYRTATVLSGSMGPGMPVGAIAVLVPVNPAAVKVGDVITFQAPIAGHPVVTHRVVEILEGGAHPVFRTKGDANRSADPWSARIEGSPAWRRVAVVPYAGTVIRWLRSAPIHHATVQVVPVLLLAVLLATIWSRSSKAQDRALAGSARSGSFRPGRRPLLAEGPRRRGGRAAVAGQRERARARKRPIVRLTAVLVLGGAAIGASPARATFVKNPTPSPSQTLTALADWVFPQVTSVIARATPGYLDSSIKTGTPGNYYVYANIVESGNPASGISSETANISTLTTGATAVTLTAGTYPAVKGVTYGYRSALQTPNAVGLTEGIKAYSVHSTDVAGNAGTPGFTVTVDNTKPFAFDVQTTNAGTAGKAEPGDTIAFTFSEQIDPESILGGWTGATQNVTVQLIDGGCLIFCGNDSFKIYNSANTAPLPLGTVDLGRSDYNGAGSIGLGAQPTVYFSSTMVQSGSVITVTLGTASNGTANTASGNGTMSWNSDNTPYDAAGNLATGNSVNEGGSGDKDF